MELPSIIISSTVTTGNIYYFTSECPIGIKGHMHVCIKRNNQIVLFTTCTSQTNTVYNFIKYTGADPNTFPCIKKDEINKFDKDLTYINCNTVTIIPESTFIEYIKQGIIKPFDGKITETQIQNIVKGVKLSTQVSENIKKMLEQ